MRHYVSTTIPYVNGTPHIGHAQEFVLADALRRSMDDVYFQSGADENSLKNVLSAQASATPTAEYVDARADEFETLARTLGLELDDFIRTSSDPRHQPVVERVWRACVENGDIYRATYEGLYCVGCEQFFTPDELDDGQCPEHLTEPEVVAEENYFFRLLCYRETLIELIERRTLNIEPVGKRNEVLAYLRDLKTDLSVSRSAERAHGWGIPVPDDPQQVIYVWIDALTNYVSAPGEQAWQEYESITHVVGKGVLRFHAVYWPAVLLSAGLRLPDNLFVHNYVTVEGQKIGKSLGNAIAPAEPVETLGVDAFRFYLLRHVGCYRDGDFSWARYREVYEQELVNQLGNLVARVVKLVDRHDALPEPQAPLHVDLHAQLEPHLRTFALHKAMHVIWTAIEATNAYVSRTEPWKLEGAEQQRVLANAMATLSTIAQALAPFLPQASARMLRILDGESREQLFPRHRG